MSNSSKLGKILIKNNIEFVTGVPDSLLKPFIQKLKKFPKIKHMSAVNEGNAIALAAGWQVSKNKLPLVYMQNSGLGNAVNPLISLTHQKVYSIPLVLLIGWRGEPNKYDEPQHVEMGKITRDILNLLKIKTLILGKFFDQSKIEKIISYAFKKKRVVALLIKKEFFKDDQVNINSDYNNNEVTRFDFLKSLLSQIPKNTKIISTTGYTSREVNEIRKENKFLNGKDFYMVGAMGHTSIFSLGVAEGLRGKKKIVCIDGDGSMLMHLGSLFSIGKQQKLKLKYILLNNNCHESVGSQQTGINSVNLKLLSKSLGFKTYLKISKKKEMKNKINKFLEKETLSFLEVKIKNKSIKNLGRPKNFKNVLKNFIL